MSEKFTPGEWHISTEDDDCFIVRDKNGGFVCYGGCFDPNNKSEVEAAKKDICLIAKAPQMYRELDKLKNLFITFSYRLLQCKEKKNAERWMKKAMEIEKLLREARGEECSL